MKAKINPISIGIADEYLPFAARLRHFLTEQEDYEVSFCANDGERLLALSEQHPTDCIIVHLFLPFLSGLEAIQMIRKENESMFIIACSATYQEDIANMLSKLGGVLYCERDVETIRSFLTEKGRRESASYCRYVKLWKERSASYGRSGTLQSTSDYEFTTLELRIIALVSSGHTNCKIADIVGKSKRTVDTYIDRMIRGIGLNGRTGLASYAYEHGICKLYCESGKDKSCCRNSIFTPIINEMDWSNRE